MNLEQQILNQAEKMGVNDEIHIEDLLHATSEEDSEHYDSDGDLIGLPANDPAHQQQQQQMPTGAGGGNNTGPKGVLQDYKAAMAQARRDRNAEKRRIVAKAKKGAMLLTREFAEDRLDSTASDIDDSDLDAVMLRHREQRLAEMMADCRLNHGGSKPAAGDRRKFGTYTKITAETYAVAIDRERLSNATVLVHIYTSPTSPLHTHLRQLALMYGCVKFLFLPCVEAPHLDPVALPAILVYKRGDLMRTLLAFTSDLSSGDELYSLDDVERALLRNGALLEDEYMEIETPTFVIGSRSRRPVQEEYDSDE